jgi:Flp pilus assembly protein TadG
MNPIMTSYAYMRTILDRRVVRLREAQATRDRGASAVELAIITAVILVIAGIILAAIKTFVTTQSGSINGGGGGG